MMSFHWEIKDGNWLLDRTNISIRETDGCWLIYVDNRPMLARYTSAKDAAAYVEMMHIKAAAEDCLAS